MDEVILSRIRQEAYEQGYQDGKVDGYNLAGTRMSSAKQEWKKGKWEDVDSEAWSGNTFGGRCTICGFYHVFIDGNTAQYNFCPNCGADMREEAEDD